MDLVIDVGNTFVKFAVFQEDEIVFQTSTEVFNFEKEFKNILKKYSKIKDCIISSVGNLNKDDYKLIQKSIHVLVLDSETKLPFQNKYKTPKTLGVDRLALVSGAVKLFPQKNVLVIDAGTCITFDFISKENTYLGGAISPGIRMRYKSLNNLTANLPLLETKLPEHFIGDTTGDAIHSGVVFGVLSEIEGAINQYMHKYSDLTVILTGGDANFLSKQLKSSIFANSNFLLQGLNHILQFNKAE
ncbi:type III pantothenate kinase [Xanthomarina spongicola]|uniref:Type III pantothenate kinase n=1 Tax=Xanthomarina spongicola TaxID=570520 RepID=A0A316DPL0_9FLAO|nr:type III pantothenate kinase [Xanthomarina spongicola]PWK19099.1 type III pantothenate kinase [Xanthomarina spongicola]